MEIKEKNKNYDVSDLIQAWYFRDKYPTWDAHLWGAIQDAKKLQNVIDMGITDAAEELHAHGFKNAYDPIISILESRIARLKELRDHSHAWNHSENGACLCFICGLDGNA